MKFYCVRHRAPTLIIQNYLEELLPAKPVEIFSDFGALSKRPVTGHYPELVYSLTY